MMTSGEFGQYTVLSRVLWKQNLSVGFEPVTFVLLEHMPYHYTLELASQLQSYVNSMQQVPHVSFASEASEYIYIFLSLHRRRVVFCA